jgi:hypothetical protein
MALVFSRAFFMQIVKGNRYSLLEVNLGFILNFDIYPQRTLVTFD